jgi:hypothetical protein
MPINIEPDELADIILSISSSLQNFSNGDLDSILERTDFEEKNRINNLSIEYAQTIKRNFVKFVEIEEFLSMPENSDYQSKYNISSGELHAKCSLYKTSEQDFGLVLEKIIELLINRDNDLKKNKHHTRSIVYYMYYHCDIGEHIDSSSE